MIAAVEPGAAAAAPVSPASPEERLITLQQTVSPSRLTLFLQCRLKFYFRYVAQIAKPKTPALHVGSSVHAVLKAWNKARWRQQPLTLKQLHEEYVQAWADAEEPVTWEDGEEESEKQTGWRLVETYFRESKIPDSLKPDAVEVPVETDLAGHGLPVLIGVLDLVQAGRIIDFKTSSTTPNAEKVAHTTEVQTSSYAVLYREATGRRETGIELHHLVKLKNPKLVITRRSTRRGTNQERSNPWISSRSSTSPEPSSPGSSFSPWSGRPRRSLSNSSPPSRPFTNSRSRRRVHLSCIARQFRRALLFQPTTKKGTQPSWSTGSRVAGIDFNGAAVIQPRRCRTRRTSRRTRQRFNGAAVFQQRRGGVLRSIAAP